MENAAAFLDTHRYPALKGGSLGFTKWGVGPDGKRVFGHTRG